MVPELKFSVTRWCRHAFLFRRGPETRGWKTFGFQILQKQIQVLGKRKRKDYNTLHSVQTFYKKLWITLHFFFKGVILVHDGGESIFENHINTRNLSGITILLSLYIFANEVFGLSFITRANRQWTAITRTRHTDIRKQ